MCTCMYDYDVRILIYLNIYVIIHVAIYIIIYCTPRAVMSTQLYVCTACHMTADATSTVTLCTSSPIPPATTRSNGVFCISTHTIHKNLASLEEYDRCRPWLLSLPIFTNATAIRYSARSSALSDIEGIACICNHWAPHN